VRRVLRAAAGVAVAGLLVGGCGFGSSRLGAAAFVDGVEIPTAQVHGQLMTVLAKESPQVRAQLEAGHQLGDVSRKIVTVRIRHQLLETAARRAGVTVDQAQVNRLVKALGGAEAASKGTIFDAKSYRQRAADQLLMAALGRAVVRTSAITVDYTTADTRTAAEQRVAELAQDGSTRARRSIAADVRAGKDAELDKRIVAGDDPIFATTPAFGVAEGTVVAFQLEDTKPWVVMVVRNRTDRGVQPSEHAPPVDAIDPTVLEAIGLHQLSRVGAREGVRLSPRYGIWDPVNLQVVSDVNETGGFIAPLRASPLA